jgi:hypothetical protein
VGAVAKCWPSSEYQGDVGDGTVKDPGSCGGRAIPCCRRAGVCSFVDRRRSRLGRDVAEGVDEERIMQSPRKPGRGGCRLVPREGVVGRIVFDVV